MSEQHLPTVILQCDVFPEDHPVYDQHDSEDQGSCTPNHVALMAWMEVCDWVANGYFPMVTVLMPDGSRHEIDVEEVLKEESK
jgi:hypothetical protein